MLLAWLGPRLTRRGITTAEPGKGRWTGSVKARDSGLETGASFSRRFAGKVILGVARGWNGCCGNGAAEGHKSHWSARLGRAKLLV